MKIIDGVHQGSLVLDSSTTISGILEGDLTVTDGNTAIITGIIGGGIVVMSGGRAVVNGIFSASAVNDGGYLEIAGTVQHGVHTNSGETVIHPGAVT